MFEEKSYVPPFVFYFIPKLIKNESFQLKNALVHICLINDRSKYRFRPYILIADNLVSIIFHSQPIWSQLSTH